MKTTIHTPRWSGLVWVFAGWLGLAVGLAADFQGSSHLMPIEEDFLNYNNTPASDVISRLQKRLDAGEVRLGFDARLGYLPDLLKALGVSPSSQMLVFSKTSLQREKIHPANPRAVFFNDDVYIGYIPGAPVLEVASADPKLGGVFYTLEQQQVEKPKITRQNQCIECHASAKTMGVPGHLVRSFETDESGIIDMSTGTSLVNHRTPLSERWGGWYVTGQHGKQTHRGNLLGKEAFKRQQREPNYLGNLTDLGQFFDQKPYLEKSSDIVALMVFEHQSHLHNFIARIHYQAARDLQQFGHLNYMKSAIDGFVKYLVFAEEVVLTEEVQGNTRFAAEFAARAVRDPKGRSLRDFDLKTRMFKYPCSYLIYSEAFDGLPAPLREAVYQRLWDVLSAKAPPGEYASLPEEARRAVIEIIAATKKGLPPYWKPGRVLASSEP